MTDPSLAMPAKGRRRQPGQPRPTGRTADQDLNQAVGLGWRSRLVLILISLAGLAMFAWPLWVPATADGAGTPAPWMFMVLLPALIVLLLAQIADQGIDVKALAMLAVLSAVNAALRPLGAGTAGIETVFFLLILAGRVFGAAFGFLLGCTSLFASALLTAGVGPWMPFQMLASAWIGAGAGLLPKRWGRRPIGPGVELAMLAVYGVLVSYLYGAIMNLWFWPFMVGLGSDSSLAYQPGGSLAVNLWHFLLYTLLTSTAVWDSGRAITTVILLLILGRPVLAVLRRTVRRARFDPEVLFEPAGAASWQPARDQSRPASGPPEMSSRAAVISGGKAI
ncbi:MAG: ECF transporter S component [Propionibacteriaceae bacterium]|jgi:energy-coupling factor transport system substrate-specific component|nr:ECF transporter S component [Propionibacteriaceae bacterium]